MENKPLTSIRGIAALWVVALHITESSTSANFFFSVGYTAVDMFFILSGMILSRVYRNIQISSTGNFLLKRVCRVYPAHIVSLIILTVIVFYPVGIIQLLISTLNIQYLASIMLLQSYISIEAPANPVAWSVGIELGCYLLFPLAIICVRRLRPLGPPAVLTLIISLAIEWIVCSHFYGATHGAPAMIRGISGFGLGMIIWRISSGIVIKSMTCSIIELLSILLIFLGVINKMPETLPISFAFLLFALSYDAGIFAIFLRSGLWFWLGRISFSVYLLHYPILLIVEKWLPILSHLTLEEPTRLVAILSLTLLASTLLYWFVESPGRRIPMFLGKHGLIEMPDPLRSRSAALPD